MLVAINILSGTNRQTDALIACDIVPALVALLERDSDPSVIKNVCFALSNIAASWAKHIEALLEAGVYSKLIEIYNGTANNSIKTEILHVLSNTLCNQYFNEGFRQKLGMSFLDVLIASLSSCDNDAIFSVLQALTCFLKDFGTLPKHGKIGLHTY